VQKQTAYHIKTRHSNENSVFECFAAGAAAWQTIRHLNEQVPKNKPYADDFF
jgi:hypothetical protein